jgi:mannose-6-phosphate isomerase class I
MLEIGVLKLHGVVQHYDWVGHDFIPGLSGIANSERRPFAELWMGAHPKAPATADVAGIELPLDRLIAEAPDRILGPSASARFGGRLPYLVKILDVARMLSIQAHPTKEQAADGFAGENAAAIDLGAVERNYKDENHKPEMAVALTDFWMLHGFRSLGQIAEALRQVPELRSIMPDFSERLVQAGDAAQARRNFLRDLCRTVMTMPQERVDLRRMRSLGASLRERRPIGTFRSTGLRGRCMPSQFGRVLFGLAQIRLAVFYLAVFLLPLERLVLQRLFGNVFSVRLFVLRNHF